MRRWVWPATTAVGVTWASMGWAQTSPPSASFPVDEPERPKPRPSTAAPGAPRPAQPSATPDAPPSTSPADAADEATPPPGSPTDEAGPTTSAPQGARVPEAAPAGEPTAPRPAAASELPGRAPDGYAPGALPATPAGATPQCVPAPGSGDHDAVFRAFSRFAETQRRARIAGAVGGVVVGGTTIAMGVAFADYFGFRPEPFYVLGGVATVLPLLSLFSYSNAERYAREVRAEDSGHTEADSLAMRRNWAHFADTARQQRYFGAGASFVMSALAVGLGIAVLEGAFEMTRDDRTLWGTTLVGLGGGIAASGVTGLFVKTPMETAYEQFEATMPPGPRLNVGVGASAGQVQLSFRF